VVLHVSLAHRAGKPEPRRAPTLVPGEKCFDGFARYGFRVPFALISPWARRHFVSHQVYDHTSILKLVETKWNLPALTYRERTRHRCSTCSTFAAHHSPSRPGSPATRRSRPFGTELQRDRPGHHPAPRFGDRLARLVSDQACAR